MTLVRVAAAVIVRPDGQVLLAQRPEGKPYAGYWEFPGGKLEPGEAPRDALVRELHEELGIGVVRAAPWLVQTFVYPHAHVELNFFRVFAWRGEPHGHDGQAFTWQVPGAFDVSPLLPANTRVLAALSLPAHYGITCAEEMGEDAFMRRAAGAFAGGLRLAQVREPGWPPERRRALVQRLAPLARDHGAKLLWNGDANEALELRLDGVHWNGRRLMQFSSRPEGMLVGASCHDAAELDHATRIGCDFAVLGPVLATPSHRDARPLGFDGFAGLVASTRIPVYALGGMQPGDLASAVDCGAHGIAMRRGAWAA